MRTEAFVAIEAKMTALREQMLRDLNRNLFADGLEFGVTDNYLEFTHSLKL